MPAFASRRRHSWSQRFLLAEALPSLAIASLAVRLRPFRKLVAPRQPFANDHARADVQQLRWAVEAWARRVPWKAMCIQRAICLRAMLRRRGVPSELHYGIRRQDGAVQAHVWLVVDGEVVIGGEAAPDFALVASFPR